MGIYKKINDNPKLRQELENNLFNIIYKEIGNIPLFPHTFKRENNEIKIGSAGGMTRLSTGYTFLNIQEHSNMYQTVNENLLQWLHGRLICL